MELPWASIPVTIPILGALLCGLLPKRAAPMVGLFVAVLTAASAGVLAWHIVEYGVVVEALGGWPAPLGIELYAHGFSVLLVATTAVICLLVSLYSLGYFRGAQEHRGGRPAAAGHHTGFFWPLWLVTWAGLNGVFLSSDLFNIYVCMEVMSLGSVALVALAGRSALKAAYRYLLVTLAGSLFYLIGVALLYSQWGTLELSGLGSVVEPTIGSAVAFGAMVLGLALKTALVPLHFWLPAAHADAPAPVSALLSALVIKASFFVLLRLWTEVFSSLELVRPAVALACLGGVALFWGTWQALRQRRFKMLVAYSTVAQIGFLFVAILPVAVSQSDLAWRGLAYFIVNHGVAKAAMFLAAGAAAASLGDDHFASMRGRAARLKIPLLVFGMAGISLIGLPHTGGYLAKSHLHDSASMAGMPAVATFVSVAGILTALYVIKVFYHAFASAGGGDHSEGAPATARLPRSMVISAFTLAIITLGLDAVWPFLDVLLQVGVPLD